MNKQTNKKKQNALAHEVFMGTELGIHLQKPWGTVELYFIGK